MAGMMIEYPSESGSEDDDEGTDSDDPFVNPFPAARRRCADDDSDSSDTSDGISDDELDKFMTGMLKKARDLEEKQLAVKEDKLHTRNQQIESNYKLHAAKQKQRRQSSRELDTVNRMMETVQLGDATCHNETPKGGSQSFTRACPAKNNAPSGKYGRPKSVGIGGEQVKSKHIRSNVKADLVVSKIMAEEKSKPFDIWDFLKKSRPVLPPISSREGGNSFLDTGTGGLPGVDV